MSVIFNFRVDSLSFITNSACLHSPSIWVYKFACLISQSSGDFPRPPTGLCPWTPLGTPSLDPLFFPSNYYPVPRLWRNIYTVSLYAVCFRAITITCLWIRNLRDLEWPWIVCLFEYNSMRRMTSDRRKICIYISVYICEYICDMPYFSIHCTRRDFQ